MTELENIYKYCTAIDIQPHNPHLKDGSVTLKAHVSIKHKDGTYRYAQIYSDKPTLADVLKTAEFMVLGYKKLVEECP